MLLSPTGRTENIMIKIAIIGTGIIAASHIDAISKLDCCEISALCDLNEARVKELAKSLSVPYFLDYRDIPDKVECDAVILNLPHGLHAPASVFFLERGIHVLVEKPMANTVAECEEMIAAEKRGGARLAVAHVQRFFKANRIIKNIVDSGELGKLCMYNEQRSINYFLDSRPAWFTNKKMSGGGIVMNYGAHAFDKLFYITGSKPVSVSASADNLINERDVEGHAQIFAKLESGVSATVTLSGYSDVVYEAYYYFTGGAIKIVGTYAIEIRREGEKAWTKIEDTSDTLAFVREIDEFCKYIRGEESEIPDAAYGRDIVRLIEDAYSDALR